MQQLSVLALVNKGNCCLSKGELEKAIEFYKEALSNEASCVEALYNLGKIFLYIFFTISLHYKTRMHLIFPLF